MFESTAPQRDKLLHDLQLVIADAEELLRMTADQIGDGTAEVRSRIQDRLQAARAELASLQDEAAARLKAAGHATDAFVHENPWKSIGIAAAIGLVVGLLVARR
ncbi:MAG: YqjD family protein [Hylemonella sp.]